MQYDFITKLLNWQGFFIANMEFINEVVEITLGRNETKYLCSRCREYTDLINGQTKRRVKHLGIFQYPTYITFPQYELRCPCGFTGVEELEFIDKMSRTTKLFENDFYDYSSHMDIKNLSELKGIDKTTGYRIDKKYLEQDLAGRQLGPIEILHADEIAVRKGHEYLSILSVPEEPGKVIDVAESRQSVALAGMLERLGLERLKGVKAFCIDMWEPFEQAIREKCPQALIVYDKFHIIKHLNEALDNIRRQLQAQESREGRKVFKGKRWLLLRRGTRLNLEQKKELADLKKINEPIATGYILKEDFYRFFNYERIGWAKKFYGVWREKVLESGLTPLIKFVKMLDKRIEYVFNYFKFRINNGFLEGLNNKIKTIKKIAYGFKDMNYFRLKILQQCGGLI